MTRASVIVPSRGGALRLPRLLTALAAQTHPDLEVIVVLDGVIDDSEAVLAASDLPVQTIVFPENRGRSAALNAGFDAATGDVLIRCDDDLETPPGWVAAHVASHTGAPTGIVGLSRNVYPDGPYARAYGRRADELFTAQAYSTPPERTWKYWAGNVSVTRETYDRIGPYSAAYRTYGWEDVDWGYRLHAQSIPVRIEPLAECLHHGASVSTAIRSQRAYLSGAARRTFEEQHGVGAAGRVARPGGAWGAAVLMLARGAGEKRVRRFATFADRMLPLVPPVIGEKLVALSVESAAIAGYDRNDPDRTVI